MLEVANRPDAYQTAEFGSAGADVIAITVPDAHLLFTGEFKRVGSNDLKIVGEDGESFFIPDYFASDKRPHLMSPEGATLSSQVVEALAGPLAPGQHAQAGTPAASGQPVIGRVDALSGSATVVRNGVTVALNVGDNVRRGDVVQTSGASSVAIVLADGSIFSLTANARMVLDNLVFNASGTGNSGMISLVQGSFSFVAGQVAKNGEMRIETPVATIGIRGTAVLVEISASDGQTRFSVMVEPDGTTGSFNLYNKTTGALIATVNNSQVGWVLTPSGPLQVIAQQVAKTPGELQQELGIVQQIFTIFNNNQQNPFVAPAQEERQANNPDKANPGNAQAGGSSETLSVTLPVATADNPRPVDLTTLNVTITPVTTNSTGTTTTSDGTTAPGGTPGIPTPTGPSGPSIIDFSNANGPQTIVGTNSSDTIIGSGFGDTIDALGGNDNVSAGAGNDTITAGRGEGDDQYDGGADFDTITFTSANGVVFHLNETLLAGGTKQSRAQSFFTGADTFTNIDKIVASPGNDIFNIHLDGGWTLDGQAGFDTLSLAGRSEGIVATLGVATVGGSSILQGTVTAPQLGTIAFSNIEGVVGSSGNDTFTVNNLAGWTALGDPGIWEIRGDTGVDGLHINGATGLTYNLNSEVSFGTVYSTIDIATDQFRFASMESIVAGAGNDTFIVRDLTDITIDTGTGIDTVRFASGLDILSAADGPEITNFEVVDLAADGQQNIVHFDLADLDRVGSDMPLRIRGGANDIIQLTNTGGLSGQFVQINTNVLSDSVFADGLTAGIRFDVYGVTVGGTQHLVYVEHGVQVAIPIGANDDQASMAENQSATIDVLANDTGGLAATLTAIDIESISGPSGVTLGNPTIAIVNNQISIAPGTAFDGLAVGETATITINYTMQNGVGETSSATATITVVGANEGPVVTGPVTGQAFEDGAAVTLNGLANASDLDGDALGLVVVLNNLPAGVTYNSSTQSFTLNPSHAAYQSLGAGEQIIVQFDYSIFDGTVATPASVSWTVTGTNDAPVVTLAIPDQTLPERTAWSFTLPANTFFDVDGDLLSYGASLSDGSPLPGWLSFNAATRSFSGTPPSEFDGSLELRVTASDGALTAFDVFTLSITENNPPEVSGPVTRLATEDGPSVSLDALENASDGDTLTVVGLPSELPAGVTFDSETQELTLDPSHLAYQSLAAGEQVTVEVAYGVSDGTSTTPTSASWTVTGTNDAPEITTPPIVAAVQEDATLFASGTVTATDADADAIQLWSVVGGSPSGSVDYTFSMDSLTITKNGGIFFNDEFDDGTPPPIVPAGSIPLSYAVSGAVSGTYSEAGGRLIIDDSGAAPALSLGSPDPLVGQFATLRTGIDTNQAQGLRSGDNFTVEGRFDLILPDSPRESYGLRLTDRLQGGDGTPPDQPGDDAIELVVRRGQGGTLVVQLRELDFAADTVTTIQSIVLAPPTEADQIVLNLSHSTTDIGAVHASFNYLAAGVVVGTQSFSQVGYIFGAETPEFEGDDENWTLAQIVTYAPAVTDSILIGTYGTLSINQAGQWNYFLANGQTDVQALAANDSVTEFFEVQVSDRAGVDTQTISVVVTGTNDAPVITDGVDTGYVTEDAETSSVSGTLNKSDIDNGDTATWSVEAQEGQQQNGSATVLGTYGALNIDQNGQWTYTLDNDSPATQALGECDNPVEAFTIKVTDLDGAFAEKVVEVTVNGVDDDPVAQNDTASMTENQVLFVDVLANDAEGLSKTLYSLDLDNVTITGPEGVLLGMPAIVIEDNKIRITPGTAFDALAMGEEVAETATIIIPYTMQTDTGMFSATATVTVTGTNDAPYFSVLPNGWQPIGAVQDGSYEGLDALLLSSGEIEPNEPELPYPGVSQDDIEIFLGLIPNTLDQIEADTTGGSAVRFDLALVAGETITFSWNFVSDEYTPFNDYAFVSVASDFAQKLSDISMIGDDANDGFLHSSSWLQYTYTAPETAEYRFGIGVMNEGDIRFESFLYLSGFSGIGFRRTTTEIGGVQTFNLLNGALDPDTNDELSVIYIVVTYPGDSGAVTMIDGNEVTIDPGFFSYLSDGESVTVVINYDLFDGHTTRHNSATLVVEGTNGAPVAGNVALQANFPGNGGFEALPDFEGWTVDLATCGLEVETGSSATINRTGTIFAEDEAVAVMSFSGSAYEAEGTAQGPSITSETFAGLAGDTLRFTYQLSSENAQGPGDRSIVTGVIIDAETNEAVQTIYYNEVASGQSTGPLTVDVELDYSGQFRIQFTLSSQDETGDSIVGSRLDLGSARIVRTGVSEDSPFIFGPAAFTGNATDDENDDLSLYSVSCSTLGASVSINEDGSVTYDPTMADDIQSLYAGDTIEDTFTFTLVDQHGAFSNVATATLIVHGANELGM